MVISYLIDKFAEVFILVPEFSPALNPEKNILNGEIRLKTKQYFKR
jgi:hypothetical protein